MLFYRPFIPLIKEVLYTGIKHKKIIFLGRTRNYKNNSDACGSYRKKCKACSFNQIMAIQSRQFFKKYIFQKPGPDVKLEQSKTEFKERKFC